METRTTKSAQAKLLRHAAGDLAALDEEMGTDPLFAELRPRVRLEAERVAAQIAGTVKPSRATTALLGELDRLTEERNGAVRALQRLPADTEDVYLELLDRGCSAAWIHDHIGVRDTWQPGVRARRRRRERFDQFPAPAPSPGPYRSWPTADLVDRLRDMRYGWRPQSQKDAVRLCNARLRFAVARLQARGMSATQALAAVGTSRAHLARLRVRS